MRITLLFEPLPARYIRTKWGLVPSSEHQKYIKGIRFWLRNHAGHFNDPDEPLAMMITYYLPRPSSVKRDMPTVKPDLDNLTKPMLDAFKPEKVRRKLVQEGVICDDAQITDLYLRKRYAKTQPKTVVTIWKINLKKSESSDYPVQELLALMPGRKK